MSMIILQILPVFCESMKRDYEIKSEERMKERTDQDENIYI